MAIRKLPCPTNPDAGYDTVVKYYTRAATLNAFGEADPSVNVLVAGMYGNIKTGTGNEVYRAKQVHAEITAVLTLPWNATTATFDADGYFEVNGKRYEILYVDNKDEQNVQMIFGCRHTST